ncbi:MAG: TatD family hydrolase [Thermoguttaceae bacterium]|nr:TatD family hydrolase [Thermoguttaceae bacterium]
MTTDYHCHLYEPIFDADRDGVIARAKAVGVTRFCCDASKESDWVLIEKLYKQYGGKTIRPGFGIHPWFADAAQPGWQERLVEKLKQYPDAVAAEIGIDWIRRTHVPFDVQTKTFLEQMEIARNLNRSVTIHCVRAWDKMPALFNQFGKFAPEITFHSFSGSVLDAQWFLSRYNAFFSFGVEIQTGKKESLIQTYKYLLDNAPQTIRFESDSPYMPLVKGERNEPANIQTHFDN